MILPSNNLYKTTHSQQVNFNAKNVTSPGNLSKVGINFQANQATAPATIPTRNVNHNHQMPLNIEKTNSIISTPVPNIDKRTSLMSSQNYQGNRSTQNMKVSFG